MRVFRDLGLVEQLGSGVPRILETYSRDCFTFSDNFFRMAFPAPEMDYSEDTKQVSGEAAGEVKKVVKALEGELKRSEIQKKLSLKHDDYFRLNYIEPAMKAGFIEMTHPESPNHPNQKYRLTEQGKDFKKNLE